MDLQILATLADHRKFIGNQKVCVNKKFPLDNLGFHIFVSFDDKPIGAIRIVFAAQDNRIEYVKNMKSPRRIVCSKNTKGFVQCT